MSLGFKKPLNENSVRNSNKIRLREDRWEKKKIVKKIHIFNIVLRPLYSTCGPLHADRRAFAVGRPVVASFASVLNFASIIKTMSVLSK